MSQRIRRPSALDRDLVEWMASFPPGTELTVEVKDHADSWRLQHKREGQRMLQLGDKLLIIYKSGAPREEAPKGVERASPLTAAPARLEARISSELQKRLKRAAEIEGRSVTDYVITAVDAATRQTIEQTTIMRLSDEATRVFTEALLSPPAPNKALKQAAERRRKRFGAS